MTGRSMMILPTVAWMATAALSGQCPFAFGNAVLAADNPANSPPATQPAPTTLPATGVQQIAERIRPLVPKGWTLQVRQDRIEVERTEAVEVYNGVGLPNFRNRQEFEEFVGPHVSTEAFSITLRITERMSSEDYERRKDENSEAERKGRKAIKDQKLLKTDLHLFLKDHPEFGYRQLPSFRTDQCSIYLNTSLHPFLRFYNADVRTECNGVVDHIRGLFEPYAER